MVIEVRDERGEDLSSRSSASLIGAPRGSVGESLRRLGRIRRDRRCTLGASARKDPRRAHPALAITIASACCSYRILAFAVTTAFASRRHARWILAVLVDTPLLALIGVALIVVLSSR